MNPYMVSGSDPGEGAALVFAATAKDARKLGAPTVLDWMVAESWIEVRAKRLRGSHLFALADAGKLAANVPHVIESPECCSTCERWGGEPLETGGCTHCSDEDYIP